MFGGRSTKSILLGVLSIAPLALIAAALVQFAVIFTRLQHAVATPFGPEPTGIETSFSHYGALVVMAGIVTLVALVVLLIDAITNVTVGADQRLLWVLLLVFANVVGYPVYWYVVHWRRPAAISGGR
jgi:uncharacterized membrane protein